MSPPLSPWVLMQRRAGLYPGAGLSVATLSRIAHGAGVHPRARGFARFGFLGASTTVQEGVTGIKAGTTAASVSTAIGTSVAGAIGAGAAAGSVVPIIGTAIGALVGLFASGVLSHHADPEVANFNQAVQLHNSNPQSVLNIANKYLVLAGLFDLLPSQIKGNIPIYKKYGRMGEERFVRDLAATIQSAANTGRITASDTPMSVYENVVQPWIASFGYGPMQDANADMINSIILGMTAEYLAGQQNRWFARGGDYPFGNLPKFTLPISTTAAGAATPAPINTSVPTGPAVQLPPGYTRVSDTTGPLPVYVDTQGTYWVLNGSTLSPYTGSLLRTDSSGITRGLPIQNGVLVVSTPAVPTAPAAQVPPGYMLVSGASGSVPVYVDPQGAYWQLAGSTLSPYTGTLAVNGQLVPVQNGLLTQQTVAQLPGINAPGPLPVISPVNPSPARMPVPMVSPATAGVSGNTALWIAGGLAVLGVIFATARPISASVKRA